MLEQEANLRGLLNHSKYIDNELLTTADSFFIRSKSLIPLSPIDSIARSLLACHAAITYLQRRLNLPEPIVSKPPIRPTRYKELLKLFERELLPKDFLKSPSKPKIKTSPLALATTTKTITLSPSKKQKLDKSLHSADVAMFLTKSGIQKKAIPFIKLGFEQHEKEVRHRWALLCSLVVMTYIRIDQTENKSKRNLFIKNLLNLQRGSLELEDVQYWVPLVKQMAKGKAWLRDLDRCFHVAEHETGISGVGRMIRPSQQYTSQRKIKNYRSWRRRILNEAKRLQLQQYSER